MQEVKKASTMKRMYDFFRTAIRLYTISFSSSSSRQRQFLPLPTATATKRMPLRRPNGKAGPHAYRTCRLLTFVVAFFFFSNLSAQTIDTNQIIPIITPPKKFSFGIRAGLNVAQIFGSGSQAFNHFGFSGGVKFGYRFSNKFSFEPEVLYNMKGAARYPNLDKGETESFSIDLDYIDIPLIFNFYFGKKANLSLEFGPSIGFLVRDKAFINGAALTSTNGNFNIYDLSLLIGLNYNLPKGFGLNLRFMNSIAPIQPIKGQFQPTAWPASIGQLNSVLNFSVNYRFDFSKRVVLNDGTIKGRVFKEKEKKREKVKKQKGDVVDEEE